MGFQLGKVVKFKGTISPQLRRAVGCAGHEYPYESPEEVQEHMDRLEARDERRARTLVAFKCPACDGWHLGHKRPEGTRGEPHETLV